MAIRTFDDDLNIIAGLPDEPTEEAGLSAAELKAKFDEGGNAIQGYINDTLIPDVEAESARVEGEIDAKVAAAEIASGNIPAGGTAGQFIKKNSGTGYDYGWGDVDGDSTATANTLMQRDANGRAQVADPVDDGDIATKGYVDSSNTTDIVGSIFQGLTNPWGENGLLCNGGRIYQEDYPELYSVLPKGPVGKWKYARIAVSQTGVYNGRHLGDYVIQCGYRYDGQYYEPAIWYTGDETVQSIPKYIDHNYYYCMDAMYDGENYILVCARANNQPINLLYAASPNTSSWTTVSIGVYAAQDYFKCKYINGYYVIVYSQGTSYNIRVTYSQSLIAGSWASITLGSVAEYPCDVYWDGSQWVVLAITSSGKPVKYTSSAIETGWGRMEGSQTVTGSNQFATFLDGAWYFGGQIGGLPYLYYSSDFINWTVKEIDSSSLGSVSGLIHIHGYYVVVTRNSYMLYAESINGPWARVHQYNLADNQSYGLDYFTNIIDDGKGGIVITGYSNSYVGFFRRNPSLPEISPTGAYAYIKSREV